MHEIVKQIGEYKRRVGEEIGVSEWFPIEQVSTDVFGAVTHNLDPMHNDPEWAREQGPWGGTVAHGFLVLSLVLSKCWKEIGLPIYSTDRMYAVNYGLDRVRFISPCRVGIPIRARVVLDEVRDKGDNRYLLKTTFSVEQKDSDKPCMIAEFLVMIVCT